MKFPLKEQGGNIFHSFDNPSVFIVTRCNRGCIYPIYAVLHEAKCTDGNVLVPKLCHIFFKSGDFGFLQVFANNLFLYFNILLVDQRSN